MRAWWATCNFWYISYRILFVRAILNWAWPCYVPCISNGWALASGAEEALTRLYQCLAESRYVGSLLAIAWEMWPVGRVPVL